MPFPFSIVVELLEECCKLYSSRKPYYPAVRSWFARYRSLIDAPDTNLSALLSTLLPENRVDRVYCMQINLLEKAICRSLSLFARADELAEYKKPGEGIDLGDSVERQLIITVSIVPCALIDYQVLRIW